MNADDDDLDGGSRVERMSSGGSKRGRRVGEDFGRDDFADDDDDFSNNCFGPGGGGGGSGGRAGSESAPSVGRAKHGKEAATGEGRAELIRRRNCENARKARARKKLEVNQLQDQVAKLKQLHAKGRVEARKAKELSTRTEVLRRQTLKTFMKYRCNNVKNYQQWAEIVHERFTMTLPITPYRWFNGQDVYNNSRILRGIEHLMTDNGSLAVLIESLGCGTLPWRREMDKGQGEGHGVELVCDIADADIVMTNNTAMCSFSLRTTNAIEHGANREWVCRGMLSAKFSPGSPKLLAAEHVFDVTSLMQQLQKVIGEEKEMPIVPNTPGGACLPSNEARVIMTATPPYTVVRCNESWTRLCGHTQESIQGQTLKAMQGPRTDPNVLAALKREIQRGRPTSSLLLNYKRDGTMFLNYLRIYPLIGDARGTITHFLGVLQEQPEPEGSNGQPQSEPKPPLGGGVGMPMPMPMQIKQEVASVPGVAAVGATQSPSPAAASAAAAAPKVEPKEEESPASINPWRGRRVVGSGVPSSLPSSLSSPSSSRLRGSSSPTSTATAPAIPHAGTGSQVQPKQEAEEDEGLRARAMGMGMGMNSSPLVEGGGGGGGEGIGIERSGMQLAEDAAAGAFLSWEDVLAGSPDPALDDGDGGGGGGGSLGEVGGANAQEDGLAGLGLGMGTGMGMEGLGGGMVAPGAGRFPDGLGDLFRIRSHSDPAVSHDGSGSDTSWKLGISMGGSALDLGRLAEEPADGCAGGGRILQGAGAEAGAEAAAGGGGGDGGGNRGGERGGEEAGERGKQVLRERATTTQNEKEDDLAERERGVRSVSDSAAWGVPAPQWGLPADSAAWDLLLPRGFAAAAAAATAAPFSTGSGAAGARAPEARAAVARAGAGAGAPGENASAGEGLLSGVDVQGRQGQGQALSQSLIMPTEDGELPVSLSDVDLRGLLLTPEELFCPPGGGAGVATGTGDLTNANLQALITFNPTLLRNFNFGGSGSTSNNFAGLGYPAAPATGGGGGGGGGAGGGVGQQLRSGDWTSANPHGLAAGGGGAAVTLDPAAGTAARARAKAQQPQGTSSSAGREGAPVSASAEAPLPTVNLPTGKSALNHFQADGASAAAAEAGGGKGPCRGAGTEYF